MLRGCRFTLHSFVVSVRAANSKQFVVYSDTSRDEKLSDAIATTLGKEIIESKNKKRLKLGKRNPFLNEQSSPAGKRLIGFLQFCGAGL